MTDEQLQEMRSRIAELEERDADFARKSNLLLDEILITRDQIAENAKAIGESRRDIDRLADRTGELAQSISELRESQQDLRQSQQLLTFTISQMAESVTILRQTQQAFVEQAVAERQTFQAEIQRIWEYLMTTRPNGRGDLGGGQ